MFFLSKTDKTLFETSRNGSNFFAHLNNKVNAKYPVVEDSLSDCFKWLAKYLVFIQYRRVRGRGGGEEIKSLKANFEACTRWTRLFYRCLDETHNTYAAAAAADGQWQDRRGIITGTELTNYAILHRLFDFPFPRFFFFFLGNQEMMSCIGPKTLLVLLLYFTS